MTEATRFNPATQYVALTRELRATVGTSETDPHDHRVDGVTIGVAAISENAPHNGERHPDGDEILYLIEGKVSVSLETTPPQELELNAGDGVVVPRGVWHRVDIIEPSRIVYVTPGLDNEHRSLPGANPEY